jgi:phosphate transport system protein
VSDSELAPTVPETAQPGEHRHGFHQELDDIGQEIVSLAASVIEAIPRATAVLLDQDLEGADYMIAADDEIDARSIDLEERCYEILARQAPVATDLRMVVVALKIIGEIERSADLAVNICKATRRIYGNELHPRLRGLIGKMGEQAQTLYRAAIDAFARRDAAKAAALDDMDELLDGLQRDFYHAIFETYAEGKTDLQVAVQLAMIARFYERIGDHAVNIAERVLFLVTGEPPAHEGAARYRASAQAKSAVADAAEAT